MDMHARYFIAAFLYLAGFAHAATLESVLPTGAHKDVRQVQARFSAAMVPLGRADSTAPFGIDCSRPGKGYWADERTWVYDLPENPRGGERCRFTPIQIGRASCRERVS
jgi:hypothetical protein